MDMQLIEDQLEKVLNGETTIDIFLDDVLEHISKNEPDANGFYPPYEIFAHDSFDSKKHLIILKK